MNAPTYTDAVLFVRELRLRLNNPKNDGAELTREELVILIQDEERDA